MSLAGYEFFRTNREARGYTLRELAENTGISFKCIHDIEVGRKEPSFTKVIALCDALGVSIHSYLKYINYSAPKSVLKPKKAKNGARGGTRTPTHFHPQPVAA
ncbi:MAG: helix-turn-helix transcriptional regulator [Planctomycetes bacterium]|nr:helix-turn-helix transcriptional regulator [Planctomycetota bacterium]